jgi:hypothetical protein
MPSEATFLSFDQRDDEHRLAPNLDPSWDVEFEDISSLTRIFSPLISVI